MLRLRALLVLLLVSVVVKLDVAVYILHDEYSARIMEPTL